MNEADNPRSVVQPHPSPLMLPNIFTNQSNAAAAGVSTVSLIITIDVCVE